MNFAVFDVVNFICLSSPCSLKVRKCGHMLTYKLIKYIKTHTMDLLKHQKYTF